MIEVSRNNESRRALKAGIDKLAETVISTLGPKGRCVIIERPNGEAPLITKDGVTVAKSFTQLENPIENMGAQLLKQASIKTSEHAGDGTTTSTLLAYNLINEGLKYLDKDSNPVEIKKGIDKAVEQVVKFLKSNTTDISSKDQIKQIGTISANNDEKIGGLIAEAMDKVGKDGIITVEKNKSNEIYLEFVEGMQFDKGFKSPYMVTDNNSMKAILEEPYVLIYDKRINQAKDILPILEKISAENKSLLIIAEDIDGEALAMLIVNKSRGMLKVAAVKAPDFGTRKAEILEDIAILTGGTVISPDRGLKLSNITMEHLGRCRLATIDKEETTIIDGRGDETAIKERAMSIKKQIEDSQSAFEKENLQSRLAKLSGGVAIINIGAFTEAELEEMKDRVDDALHATRAAVKGGVIPGGGAALIKAKKSLSKLKSDNDYQKIGIKIVEKALDSPLRQILTNSGIENYYEVISKIQNNKQWGFGYDAKTDKFTDLLKSGVIDPTYVTINALQNAASIAGTLLTTEAVIYNKEDKSPKNSMSDLMGMGDMG
jgi:chaperonin GroEL